MIYDISQEITNCKVYPGDPKPEIKKINEMQKGDLYNLSAFSMCNHNGTHIDAPSHFIENGKNVDEIPLDYFVGECFVCEHNGNITTQGAVNIVNKAKSVGSYERILIKGNCVVTTEAAKVFKESKIKLLGSECQSIGPIDSPMEVHLLLLGNNIILLEGIVLNNIDEGKYYLCAQPLNFKGVEGAPCRAILIK